MLPRVLPCRLFSQEPDSGVEYRLVVAGFPEETGKHFTQLRHWLRARVWRRYIAKYTGKKILVFNHKYVPEDLFDDWPPDTSLVLTNDEYV